MKIKGLTREQIEQCARNAGHFKLANVRQIGNYTFFVLRMASGTPRYCCNVPPDEINTACTRPLGHEGEHWHKSEDRVVTARWFDGKDHPAMRYRKKGISRMMWADSRGPRYGTAVCFHGFEAFMRECFEVNPEAQIRTKKAAYLGLEDFRRKYPAVGETNVGSQACFVAYSECCDCEG